MKVIKISLLTLGAFIVTVVLIGTIWTVLPVKTDTRSPDPATEYANGLDPSAPPFKDAYFEYQGHQLHYVEAGQGEPVIFIHGFPSFWYSFIRQGSDLRRDYRVILIDGLGTGRSDAPKSIEAYRLENMTAHLNALLDELGLEQAHFVGHDWGAGLVFGFAQQYPDRVSTVTGISSPPPNILLKLMETNLRQQAISKYIERLKRGNPVLLLALRVPERIWQSPYQQHVEAGLLTPAEGQLFRKALSDPKRINAHINWYRANLPAYEEITSADYWPSEDARLSVPTLLIWGNDDRVFVPEFIDLMQQSSDDLKVLRLDDVGHWPHLVKSDQVTAAIREIVSADKEEPSP